MSRPSHSRAPSADTCLFSLDGTRVVLYAEWTSEEAHREAIETATFGGGRGIFDGVPGIDGLSVNRYQLYRYAAAATAVGRT